MGTGSVKVDFGVLVGYAYQAFVSELHTHMADSGVPIFGPSFGYVMRALDREPLTASRIAENLGITAQGAAKVIDEMVALGYVERRPDPADKRAKLLHLSERGQELLALVRTFHADFEQRLTEQVGADQVAVVRSVLTHIIDSAPAPDLMKLFRPL